MKRILYLIMAVLMLVVSAQAVTTSRFTTLTSGISYSKVSIKITVSDTAGIDSFFLYRSLDGGAFSRVDSLAKDSLIHTFAQTGLRNGGAYKFIAIIKDTSGVYITREGEVTSYINLNSHNAISITTTAYTPTISAISDSATYTRFWIKMDSTGMATAANAQPTRYVLQYADSGSTPVSHKGDTVSSVTFPQDTIKADTLIKPGHKYACRILTKFRDGAAGDTLVDTSATLYVTIADLTPIYTITQNGDSLAIAIDTTDCGLVGATLLSVVVQRNLSAGIVTSRWTRQDSTANADTTINYNDIRAGVPFSVRFITACSLSQTEFFTDTSAVTTYNIADPYFYSLPVVNGTKGTFVINRTRDNPTIGYIPIPVGATQAKIRWRMSGYATPGFADSVRFFAGSINFDGRKIVDTLIDKTVVDTTVDSCKTWPVWAGNGVADSTYKAANMVNLFSDYLTLWADISDSATAAYADSELNQYKIYWQISWDK